MELTIFSYKCISANRYEWIRNWIKIENRACFQYRQLQWSQFDKYGSFDEAKRACDLDGRCNMIQDIGCKDPLTKPGRWRFDLCEFDSKLILPFYPVAEKFCVHKKQGKLCKA